MTKDLSYYNQLDYTVRLSQNADKSFFAEIEELPGCISEGGTREEVLDMIDDAKTSWLMTALDTKTPIPEPNREEYSGKLNVRLPKSLHRKLAHQAKREQVSLNMLITTKLAEVGGRW